MSPRLQGIRERRYANLYDSLDVEAMRSYDTLFGNANVGYRERCNLQIAGQLGSDETFIILNVYARTNICRQPKMNAGAAEVVRDAFLEGDDQQAISTMIAHAQWERTPVAKAFDEWAHTACVDLQIGTRQCFDSNVFDLMDGAAFGPRHAPDAAGPKDNFGDPLALPWRRTLARPLIVSARQNFGLRLNSNSRALNRLKETLAKHDVIPAPLVWFHLEGIHSRDVA